MEPRALASSLMTHSQKPWNGTQKEYAAKLLGMFLAGHPNHQLVFMRIWQIDPTYLTHSFRDYYNESPLNITRILDVAQDLKVHSRQLINVSVSELTNKWYVTDS